MTEEEEEEGLLQADGLDDAVIGVGSRNGQPDILVYSHSKVLDCLMADGMTYEEAVEFFEFNIGGAWVGEKTPIWVRECDEREG